MNILILPKIGGSYNSIRPEAEIYIGLANAGHNIYMMTNTDKEFIQKFRDANITLINASYDKKIDLKTIQLIRQTIDQFNIQIVYATYSRNISNASLACIGKKVKFIAYRGTTGGLYWYDPSSYLGLLSPRIDGVICVSHAVEAHVKSRVRKKIHDRVRTIYKGHDLSWYQDPPISLEQFGSKATNFKIVCVANARVHKGLRYLLEAMSEIHDLDDVHLILVGNDIEQEPYLSLIANSGMAERIHLTGYRDDAPRIIAACDVLVLPSLREGLPRVLLEALAYQVPVITTDNAGSLEIIDDEVNGLVAPRENASAIAEKIRYLHDHPEQATRLSRNGLKKFREVFSHEQTVQQTMDYFGSVLS